MSEFTPTQGRYLAFIKSYMQGFGLAPAESEMATAMKVSPPSINQMMRMLEKKGFVRRKPGVARSIEILIPLDTIPNWKGQRISRTVQVWTQIPTPLSSRFSKTLNDNAYRFKITLEQTNPAIWREIETTDVSLGDLHALIQTAMGWTNSHMHQFKIGDERFTDGRFMVSDLDDFGAKDYRNIKISDLVAKHGDSLRLSYEYDFGDGWQHEILLTKVFPTDPNQKYPHCISGERACPPEDIGGVYGFVNFVVAIRDPSHEQHDDFMDWHRPFDPDKFNTLAATKRMRKGLPKW